MNTTMQIKSATVTTVLATAAFLAGCASPAYQQPAPSYPAAQSYPSQSSQSYSTMYGVVDSIQMIQGPAANGPGLGAVAGAVVGGLLGNQVGNGNGRTAATVAGAVGGAVVGNNIQQQRAAGQPMYEIRVRLDNGRFETITQDSAADLGIGNRVRVDGGRVYRY